ncbi:MAG TPA: DUF4430 domain-containing protein [Gaiellaceae bacterium]|nr:DUF4430 domain-containing protein [Gaiellaceae bacterium]
MRYAAGVALVFALAGCGGGGEHGSAVLWVTRDRGATVVFTGAVPAGLTAMQALDRVQKITTRYGGRYVQSIGGVSGSLTNQKDWFYFVNGVEEGVGATEVRLHPGDVEWWDYRSWAHGQMSVPVVVGAWPKPVFGNVTVSGAQPAARELGRALHADGGPNHVIVTPSPVVFRGASTGGHYTFWISARDAERLAKNPKLARFHYEGLGGG